MKKIIAIALSFVIAISGLCYSGTLDNEVKAAAEWELLWSDEFDGTSLNTATWNYETGTGSWGWGNNEHEYYTNRTENVEVSNGTLKIKALRETNYRNSGKDYTSGRIQTKGKKSFKYGKIEARMKLPSFTGAWPAFWMLGASGGWPKCGEIDIMEAINSENNTYGYLHWYVESQDYNGQGDTGGSSLGKLPAGYQRTEWHTYGIIWDEESISWYIDDVVFRTASITADHMSEFRQNQYIILNLAIGGEWPGHTIDDSAFPNRSVMEVDYVRVYQHHEVPTTEYDGPTIKVEQDAVAESTNTWGSFFGNADWCGGANGTLSSNGDASDGVTLNVSTMGTDRWGIQASLQGLKYYPGNTYTYKCTLTSDTDKVVFVKVAGDNDDEISGEFISLKANVPYNYSKEVAIPKNYEGVLDLFFGLGRCDGDTLNSANGYTLKIENVSFTTTAEIPDPDYIPPTTKPEKPSGDESSSNEQTTLDSNTPSIIDPTTGTPTTVAPTVVRKVNPPARTKVKKATKKKLSKKVKLSIKRVKGAKAYRVQFSKKKKFTKKNIIATKTVKKVKVTITNKRLKNKKSLYVRVKAYKLDGKKKVWAKKWSKVKKVKIKK